MGSFPDTDIDPLIVNEWEKMGQRKSDLRVHGGSS